jgi:hypothetical protein
MAPPSVVGALFESHGEDWVPTDFSRGPWDPDALHGGPVAALVARAVERCEPDDDMGVTRLTLDLLRPVPLVPLTVTAAVTRPGRRVQIVDVGVSAQGRDLAWARALRIRRISADTAVLEHPSPGPVPGHGPPAPRLPEQADNQAPLFHRYRGFLSEGAHLRFVDGDGGELGPAQVWVRLAVPVIEGETPSPLQRAVAAADFGNGVSAVIPFERYVFINPDLTVYLERPPVGEWICLDASTRLGTPGRAVAHSRLFDVHGPIGRSLQSLVVAPRD